MTPPGRLEKHEQADIVRLLRSLGWAVYVLGTRRRTGDYQGTMQSPGIPDLEAFSPPPKRAMLKIEVKAKGGRLRPEQAVYQDLCRDADIAHLVGGVDEAVSWLIANGFLDAQNVAWYRVPRKARTAR